MDPIWFELFLCLDHLGCGLTGSGRPESVTRWPVRKERFPYGSHLILFVLGSSPRKLESNIVLEILYQGNSRVRSYQKFVTRETREQDRIRKSLPGKLEGKIVFEIHYQGSSAAREQDRIGKSLPEKFASKIVPKNPYPESSRARSYQKFVRRCLENAFRRRLSLFEHFATFPDSRKWIL